MPQARAHCFSLVVVSGLTLVSGCIGQSSDSDLDGGTDSYPAIVLEHQLTVDGDSLLFAGIRAVLADDDGHIYVAHDQFQSLHEIMVIDGNGRRVRSFGGRGEGPGEFGSLMGLTWVGDLLLANDVRLQRFSFFDPVEGFVRSWAWGRVFQNGATPPVMSNGSTGYALVNGLSSPSPGGPPAIDSVYLVFHQDSTVDTLRRIAEPRDSVPQSLVCLLPDGRSWDGGPLPFFDRGPLRAFLPESRIALGHRDRFQIDIVDLQTQEVMQVLNGPDSPIPLSSEAWGAQPEMEFFRGLAEEHGSQLTDRERGGPCQPERLRPEFYPVVRTIFSDDSGRVWAETTGENGVGFNLSVFSPDGEMIGRTEMPDRDPSVLPYVRGDRLYLVSRDSLDVQSVEVLTIQFR